jgi:hypothetical protein
MLSAPEVLSKLHEKFTSNIAQALPSCANELERIDIKARALAECGSELSKGRGLTESQLQVSSAAEEVFADIVTSAYLASIGLDKPAQLVLRRAFELGLVVVYLWDLPHMFWGWKECDQDLSFSEMLEYFTGLNYRTFLNKTVGSRMDDSIIDAAAARRLYRTASNTVHGKISTHSTRSFDGYVYNADRWKTHLILIDEVATLLLDLWFKRFPNLSAVVRSAVPAFDRLPA